MEASGQMIVFDMDGVLVDVTESYRETIVQTVKLFCGRTIDLGQSTIIHSHDKVDP